MLSKSLTTTGFVLLVASLAAQNPLTTTFTSNNGGNVGGAVYFDLATGTLPAAFQQIDLNFSNAAGTPGGIDIYVTPGTWVGAPPAAWTLAASAVVTAGGLGVPTPALLTVPVSIPAATSIGVYIVANGLAHAYTNGSTPTTSFGQCPLTLTAGGASNAPLIGPVFTPRIVNTSIHLQTTGGCATVSSRGSGCSQRFASFYEGFPPSAMDLDFHEVSVTPTSGGYDVLTASVGGIVPVGTLSPPQTVVFGGATSVPIGSLGLHVGANGWVSYGPSSVLGFVPTVAAMLTNPSTAIYAWTDLDPDAPGSGLVTYEEDPVQQLWRVTYDQVVGWGTTDPNTLQFQGDLTTGEVSVVFAGLSATNPENWLVGYSPGGFHADPGPTDLSIGGPFSIAASDEAALELLPTSGRPIQQGSLSSVIVTTTNVPSYAVLHAGILGLSQVQVPLFSLGLNNDCVLYSPLDIVLLTPAASPSNAWTAAFIPPTPSLVGFQFTAQAAVFGPGLLDAQARTSNALDFVVGV